MDMGELQRGLMAEEGAGRSGENRNYSGQAAEASSGHERILGMARMAWVQRSVP